MSTKPERTVAILQPSYLPWLGYFAQMHRSDVFVVYDDVQFDKESWRNRNRIKTSQGVQWLTVPVLTKGQDWPSNRDIKINNTTGWSRKHLAALRQNYGKAPCFHDYFALFEQLYSRPWTFLFDLNMEVLYTLLGALRFERQIVFSSQLQASGGQTERLINICTALGATHFFEGAAGKNYIDEAAFARAGIALEYQDYQHPEYPQLYGPFVPYLSTVDLLFNCGLKSLEILIQ